MVTFYKPQKKEVEKKAVKVNCTDLDLQGRGVARDDKYVYFVEGLMPGDSANVLISNVKGKVATGKITKIIKPSDKRLKKRLCSNWYLWWMLITAYSIRYAH